MKLIRQLLDLLNSLIKTWPTIVIIIGWIISAALWLFHIGQTSVSLSMPLSFLIAIGALASYPIAKLLQSILSTLRKAPFEYLGLLWKPAFVPFAYPQPLCPTAGCGMKVLSFIIPPKPIQLIGGRFGVDKIQTADSYKYQCPIHGKIHSAPNLPLHEIKVKAKLVQRTI